ncbi:hypothetical protein ASA1KI_36960 [Opitutales bacterium ASA1]|nr:hypothetical protein ASA1KI_36960 [Opitutales bacterium ASA1]
MRFLSPPRAREIEQGPIVTNSDSLSTAPSPSLARHALFSGGIAGAAVVVWTLLEFAFGFHGERIHLRQYSGLAAMVFPIAAIALGIMRWRDRGLGGTIRFSQAFGCGLAIGMVFAAIVGAFSWIYVSMINPSFIESLLAQYPALMQERGMTPDEIAAAMEVARARSTAGGYAFEVFAQMLISAFLIALFASVIVRRRS